MDIDIKTILWQQFGAAIDTLDDAIRLCPEEHWTAVLWKDEEDERFGQFWFVAYHTVFWLDLYVTGSTHDGFKPPAPFVRGKLPDNPYTQEQVQGYLHECRRKCQTIIEGLTEEKANQTLTYNWVEGSFLEMMLYTMRHIMEHAAELHLVLGQRGVTGSDWIVKAKDDQLTS